MDGPAETIAALHLDGPGVILLTYCPRISISIEIALAQQKKWPCRNDRHAPRMTTCNLAVFGGLPPVSNIRATLQTTGMYAHALLVGVDLDITEGSSIQRNSRSR
ncbi:hypothetical protein Micbo1qcDRAFT_175568 [Microdochium bolleyi]|uniref:Uncharacterized protein n=1 Tax=Microdochium bolleyi TaxID=196109 RepID=A0A136J378_9PEZI|nr:hypothetical protein Micbo1qcDRAFT_175568 [Microdochium bolleyi]